MKKVNQKKAAPKVTVKMLKGLGAMQHVKTGRFVCSPAPKKSR